MWTLLHSWISLGLHLDQSNYMGWALHITRYVYYRVKLQLTKFLLFGRYSEVHITRLTSNRVMWKTLLDTSIPLRLHLDQSKYMAWALHITRYVYYQVILQLTQFLLFGR